jgi:hypothetical protein
MTVETFLNSLQNEAPPASCNTYLQALWYDGTNHWDRAHQLIQDLPDASAAWIHAYLHRKEGDIGNADYWYRRAGKKRPAFSVAIEFEELVAAMLER